MWLINDTINLLLSRSSEARPVPFSNYLKLVECFVNKVNVIRGPVHYLVSIYLLEPPNINDIQVSINFILFKRKYIILQVLIVKGYTKNRIRFLNFCFTKNILMFTKLSP